MKNNRNNSEKEIKLFKHYCHQTGISATKELYYEYRKSAKDEGFNSLAEYISSLKGYDQSNKGTSKILNDYEDDIDSKKNGIHLFKKYCKKNDLKATKELYLKHKKRAKWNFGGDMEEYLRALEWRKGSTFKERYKRNQKAYFKGLIKRHSTPKGLLTIALGNLIGLIITGLIINFWTLSDTDLNVFTMWPHLFTLEYHIPRWTMTLILGFAFTGIYGSISLIAGIIMLIIKKVRIEPKIY